MKQECKDCKCDIQTGFLEDGELVVCPQCGLEMVFEHGDLKPLELDGVDYGE